MKKLVLFAFCIVGVYTSCVKKLMVNPDNSISLTLDTLKLTAGTSQLLVSRNYNSEDLIWTSSDTSIVSVTQAGLVSAKKMGQSQISVTTKSHSVSATCLVVVVPSTAPGTITQIAGRGTDIGIGADSSVFVVGADSVSATGGYSISKLIGNTLVKLPDCAAIRVAVSPHGVPWVINKSKLIFKYNGLTWDQMPGTGTDIGIGADGSVFIIGTLDVSPTGGYNILKWNGSGWDTLPDCAGVRISVSPQGIPWVVNRSNIVYKNSGGLPWEPISGISGKEIGIGADGSVYVTGKDSTATSIHPLVYKYVNNSWVAVHGASGLSIAVSPNGNPWWTDEANSIYKLN